VPVQGCTLLFLPIDKISVKDCQCCLTPFLFHIFNSKKSLFSLSISVSRVISRKITNSILHSGRQLCCLKLLMPICLNKDLRAHATKITAGLGVQQYYLPNTLKEIPMNSYIHFCLLLCQKLKFSFYYGT